MSDMSEESEQTEKPYLAYGPQYRAKEPDRIDVVGVLLLTVTFILIIVGSSFILKHATAPLDIRITNTSAEPLYVEIYMDGVFYLNDTIEPKLTEIYEYKNGFWGPGLTEIVVKLPNTLFEKEGGKGDTVSFVFE